MLIMVINNNQQSLSMVLTLCVHNTKTPKSIFHSMLLMDDNQIIIIIDIIRYSGRISQPRFSFLHFFLDNFQTWNDLKTFQNTKKWNDTPSSCYIYVPTITLNHLVLSMWVCIVCCKNKKFGTLNIVCWTNLGQKKMYSYGTENIGTEIWFFFENDNVFALKIVFVSFFTHCFNEEE